MNIRIYEYPICCQPNRSVDVLFIPLNTPFSVISFTSMTKRILIIAGPNGSGKTTTASTLLSDFLKIYEFINADEIAKGLSPFHPETVSLAASKLMIKRLRELLDQGKNFAFETTAAGTNYLKYLTAAKEKSYQINLFFLWLSSPELALQRVAQIVAKGGHHIPAETIKRRYHLGAHHLLKNYLPLADVAVILDNSVMGRQKIIAYSVKGTVAIEDAKSWEQISKAAQKNG